MRYRIRFFYKEYSRSKRATHMSYVFNMVFAIFGFIPAFMVMALPIGIYETITTKDGEHLLIGVCLSICGAAIFALHYLVFLPFVEKLIDRAAEEDAKEAETDFIKRMNEKLNDRQRWSKK